MEYLFTCFKCNQQKDFMDGCYDELEFNGKIYNCKDKFYCHDCRNEFMNTMINKEENERFKFLKNKFPHIF